MILIKKVWIKIYKFLAKTGFVFLQLSGMIIVAFFLVSLKLVKEEVKNPYCRIENQNVKLELNYDSIDYYTYEIHCNTLNTEIYLMDSIGKNQAISLLIEIKQQLENSEVGFVIEKVPFEYLFVYIRFSLLYRYFEVMYSINGVVYSKYLLSSDV